MSEPTTAKPIEAGTRISVSTLCHSAGRSLRRANAYAATSRAAQAAGTAHTVPLGTLAVMSSCSRGDGGRNRVCHRLRNLRCWLAAADRQEDAHDERPQGAGQEWHRNEGPWFD